MRTNMQYICKMSNEVDVLQPTAGNLRNACCRCTSCSILVKPGKGDQAEPCQHVLDGFGAPFLLEKVLEHWNQAALGRNLLVVAEGNALVRL